LAGILKNVGWSSVDGIFTQVTNLVTLAVLATLLPPALFGIMAMLNIFIQVSNILVNSGFSQALIQNQTLTTGYYSTVFWLNIALGISLYLIFLALTPAIAWFFEEPSLNAYFPIALIPLIISSTYLVHQTIIEKTLKFRTKAIVNMTSAAVSSVFAIYLAYYDYGIWALIWPTILLSSLTALLYWLLVNWRPRFHYKHHEAKELFSFGAYLTGAQLFGTFTRKFDDLLIGKYFAASDLGIYNVAYRILMFPLTFIKSKISSVLFPAFSTYTDKNELAHLHARATETTLMLITPIFVFLFLINEEAIHYLFGPEWQQLSEITTIFALTSIFISIGYPVQVLNSLGQSRKVFHITLLTRFIFFALILFAVLTFDKLSIIAIFISLGLIQHNTIANIYGVKALDQNVKDFFIKHALKVIWPYLAAGIPIFLLGFYLMDQFPGIKPIWYILLKSIIFVIFVIIQPAVRRHISHIIRMVFQYDNQQVSKHT
jgi:O-antigen/teichoic acid export membrane protein